MNEFKAIIKGINEKKYNYTIYLEPKNDKALKDWFHANAEIISTIPKDKIFLITEWRETKPWKLAEQKDQDFTQLIEMLSKIALKRIELKPLSDEEKKCLECAKVVFKPIIDEKEILEEAIRIFNRHQKLLEVDLENIKDANLLRKCLMKKLLNIEVM